MVIISAKIMLDKIMLKEIKLPLNTSLLELLTVSFFIAVGYSILYKFYFYSELGIEGYIYSLTPNFILLSSIKLLSSLLLGGIVGILATKEIVNPIKLAIVLVVFCFFLGIFLKFFDILSSDLWVEKKSISIFGIGFILAILVKTITILFTNLSLYGANYRQVFQSFILIFCILYFFGLTTFIGKKEAELVKNNFQKLNIAHLKGDKTDWRVLEFNGDKAMLISKSKQDDLSFKLVEMKEIESIKIIK